MSCVFFFFKQKTAYEMRISDWSSDVCSSDLRRVLLRWRQRRLRARADAVILEAAGSHRQGIDDIAKVDHDLAAHRRGHPRPVEGQVLLPLRQHHGNIGIFQTVPEVPAIGKRRAVQRDIRQTGRESSRESVCKNVKVSGVDVYSKKKKQNIKTTK